MFKKTKQKVLRKAWIGEDFVQNSVGGKNVKVAWSNPGKKLSMTMLILLELKRSRPGRWLSKKLRKKFMLLVGKYKRPSTIRIAMSLLSCTSRICFLLI